MLSEVKLGFHTQEHALEELQRLYKERTQIFRRAICRELALVVSGFGDLDGCARRIQETFDRVAKARIREGVDG
jgi:hypothetical protein